MSVHPPTRAQILVIGGGPSGSYAAAALAREGLDVVLLEAATFPRYHIGESLIPSVRHHLRFIDAEEKVRAHGFARKPGAAMKFNQFKREGYTDFVALGHDNASWNVVRSEFDELLLDHAASCGARVFQATKVVALEFATPSGASDLGRPTSATWVHTPPDDDGDSSSGTIEFDYVIDASGRAGLISTKYLKNRRFNSSLKNVAMWGYWAGTGTYAQDTPAEGAPWFEALTDESGWAWFIPLHDGTTSVGVVMDQKAISKHARSRSSLASSPSSPTFGAFLWGASPSPTHSPDTETPPPSPFTPRTPFTGTPATTIASPGAGGTLAARYLAALDLAPGVRRLIGQHGALLQGKRSADSTDATAREFRVFSPTGEPADGATDRDETVRTASDYSYSAETYAGVGWRIVGDAGAFIDPFFSSGVHLAMTSGLAAAVSVAAALRGDCPEADAAEWHSQRVAVSYTRFLVVVLSAYKQMRAQSADVLSDVGADNFDAAFAFLRPVIQGSADLGPRLSEEEVQRALDFCTDLFSPTTPEQHDAVRARLEGLRMPESAAAREAESGGPNTMTATSDGPDETVAEAANSRAVETASGSADGATRPPLGRGRKRSGTIDTVMKWLGKVRGMGDGAEGLLQEAPGTPPAPRMPASPALRAPASPAPGEYMPAFPDARDAVLDVTAPVLAAAQLDDIVQRVHARRTGALFIDTNVASGADRSSALLPAPDIAASASARGPSDDAERETRRVLSKINARRVIHRDHSGAHSLEEEALGGLSARLERGRLGLVRVEGEGTAV